MVIMNFLLVNMPWRAKGRTGVRAGSRWPHLKIREEEDYLPFPFFIAYATSLLKRENINAKAIDAIAENTQDYEFIKQVKKESPAMVFAEISAPSLKNDLDLLMEIKKETNCLIAVACPSMELVSENFLGEHEFIDFCLPGEYEFTLLDLAKVLCAGKSPENVPGLIGKYKGKVFTNQKRKLEEINDLPWPDRTDLPIYRYHDCPGNIPQPSVQMIASRGCPFLCSFCAWPQIVYGGRNYRTRDIKDIADEMEYLVKEKGFKSVYFDDDTFNIGKERMLAFAEELKKRNWKTPWAFMGRADLVDKEILEKLKETGLSAVKYGVESGVQEIVDASNKNLNLKKAAENIILTKSFGIKVHLTFTIGLPGETKETIKKTVDFAISLDPESVQFSIMTPFPGTKLYSDLKTGGMLESDKLEEYDGNTKSVIRTDSLTGDELSAGQRYAYLRWNNFKVKKQRYTLKRPDALFFECLKEHGLAYTIKHTYNYLKNKGFKQYAPLKQKIHKACGKIDVLFVNSPPWDVERPPYALAFIDSFLESRGISTEIIDFNMELYTKSKGKQHLWHMNNQTMWRDRKIFPKILKSFKKEIDEVVEKILHYQTDIIAFSISYPRQAISFELIKLIKKKNPKKTIVVGGPYYFDAPIGKLESELIDIIVLGEGENTLLEIIDKRKKNIPLTGIPGTITFKDGKKIVTEKKKFENQFSNYVYPKYTHFDLKQYNAKSLPLEWSRGCIARCTFCQFPILVDHYKFRKPENIIEELQYHYSMGARHFNIIDPAINGNMKQLESVCDLIIDKRLEINWTGMAMIRPEMTQEILNKMRKAGCYRLDYGLESGSDKVLKIMKKPHSVPIAREVIKATDNAGIKVVLFIIVGYPGETAEDFNKTLEFLEENKKYIHMVRSVNSPYLMEGTDLMKNPEKYNIDIPALPKGFFMWETNDKANTFEIRQQRTIKAIKLLADKGINVELNSLKFGDDL